MPVNSIYMNYDSGDRHSTAEQQKTAYAGHGGFLSKYILCAGAQFSTEERLA